MAKPTTRQLRLDLIHSLAAAWVLAGLTWGAAQIGTGAWPLFAANLGGGAASATMLTLTTALRLAWHRGRAR